MNSNREMVCRACQEVSIEKPSGCRAGWLEAESGIPWLRVPTDSTKLTIPAQRSKPPRPRAFLSIEIRVFTDLQPLELLGWLSRQPVHS